MAIFPFATIEIISYANSSPKVRCFLKKISKFLSPSNRFFLWYNKRINECYLPSLTASKLNIMYYFYSLDIDGNEYCFHVNDEDLLPQMQFTLDQLADTTYIPVEIIDGTDFQGYATLQEFIDYEAIEDEEDTGWIAAVVAGEETYGYPFAIITHESEDKIRFEVCEVDKVDWQGLILEYAGDMFKIGPVYYKEGEITAEEAEAMGATKLAAAIRADSQKE